ncbi:MAG: hypothetical protein CXZ00_15460 [Acidobacteria bacterium]|nr:MAG: hypothetical protein CXZ00_15460 [Acidobacteriota bacterium]
MELPELSAWSATVPKEQTLRIQFGALPDTGEISHFAVTEEEDVLLRVPGVAGFHLHAAEHRVTIQMEGSSDPLLVRNFLYGSVLAVLCYKRGLFPLHGASVLLNGSAVILSGPSGSGKSTLATALARRGHPLLCDDVCAIDTKVPGRPLLWPAFPRVKLLADAISNFELGAAMTYSRAASGTKGHFGMTAFSSTAVVSCPVPVAAVYALESPSGDKVERSLQKGKDAFLLLDSQAHRGWMGRNLGLHGQLFRHITALASSVPVYLLRRPRVLERLDETANLLETAHHDQPVIAGSKS